MKKTPTPFSTDTPPNFMKNLDSLWGDISSQLNLMEAFLPSPPDAAYARRKPSTIKPEDYYYSHVPPRKSDDQELLRNAFSCVPKLFQEMNRHLRTREMSWNFIKCWAKLNYYMGVIDCAAQASKDDYDNDRNSIKSAKSRSITDKRLWISAMILELRKISINRKKAEEKLVDILNGIKEEQILVPSGCEKSWFTDLLSDKDIYQLNLQYTEKKFSLKEMARLVKEMEGCLQSLPPINLEIYKRHKKVSP